MFLLVPCTITIITSKAKIPIFLKKLNLAFDANSARQHAKIRLFFRILAHLLCSILCTSMFGFLKPLLLYPKTILIEQINEFLRHPLMKC